IAALPLPAITLASGSTAQTVTAGDAITEIQYTTSNASGATATGLPDGVSGAWAADVYTISGTPTISGTFNYTITTTNSIGCDNAAATGTITVIYNHFISGTWSCGSQRWSGALRTPIATCAATTSLSTATNNPPPQYYVRGMPHGYYYNWTCVTNDNNEDLLCPSPWRVPHSSDFEELMKCTTDSALISDWGTTGDVRGSSLLFTEYSCWWSRTPHQNGGIYFAIKLPNIYGYYGASEDIGFQLRCVQYP
ncbi:MAG: fibrobacter succinogenes major paralogous domain-containing protein, partial [Prevotellaceae bacterium]|nr:fibrobacter succinogenes major paralogous domain-containing protein [Prevotellaceae bacterium]